LEIILSDDASTDRTFDIMKEMAAVYHAPHTIILNRNPRNLGLCGHVNKIFYEIATGAWLVAAAGDDISLPERCQHVAEFAKKYHANLVLGNFKKKTPFFPCHFIGMACDNNVFTSFP